LVTSVWRFFEGRLSGASRRAKPRLRENREEIDRKIRRGIEQLEPGKGIPEKKVAAYLANLKAGRK
jgi:hypothetical protein